MDRAEIVHQNFLRRVGEGDFPLPRSKVSPRDVGMTPEQLVAIFRAQVISRQLDRRSRTLQADGHGFYTIGSSGHEGNAAIAAALRVDDPAFLHYRDGAFQVARALKATGQTPVRDMLLSFVCSSDDPISGGRHKVLGSKPLSIPPQTSTIASHLPKAVGAAYSIGLARRHRPEHQQYPDDAIVMCSFGDASLNHSTAQGAVNTAGWTCYKGTPLPLLFVCEDNGIGISVKSPKGWVEASLRARPGLEYFSCDGLDMIDAFAVAKTAEQWVRRHRKPAVLHMECVRLYGHAGADAQTVYLARHEIEEAEANDPLLHSARRLIDETTLSAQDVLTVYGQEEQRIARVANDVIARPKLQTAAQVRASIVPAKRTCLLSNGPSPEARAAVFGDADLRAMGEPQHLARNINFALNDLMLEHEEIVLAGEDIGRKGGVYGVTQRLHGRFGARRVIDTLLDEQSILGLAIGLGQNGFIPIPEIQFLAYLHNAEDQLRGEAATLSFFSDGQFTNPMIVRIAGLAYQRGFGGHFHNDNSIAVLRDIPGLIIACPSNGRDATLMLRESVRLAREEQRIVVFLEPIALYMTRDLHAEGDSLWTHTYPQPGTQSLSFGEVGTEGKGTDLAIVTYGNGYYRSVQAQKRLLDDHRLQSTVVDIRWLAPLPAQSLLDATEACERILIVDECRSTGSQSEALMAFFGENSTKPVSRITADDCFIPTGPAYGATLPSRDDVIAAALALVTTGRRTQ
ncbi:MAG: thiamine pyrophosphate-dependent enzyme [Pseudomonadota bacterium]